MWIALLFYIQLEYQSLQSVLIVEMIMLAHYKRNNMRGTAQQTLTLKAQGIPMMLVVQGELACPSP